MTEQKINQIEIKIGGSGGSYEVFKTTAPIDYDGFGTLELFKMRHPTTDKEIRYVAIRQEHCAWQTGRYGSGSHVAEAVNDRGVVKDLTEKLWKTILSAHSLNR